MMLRFYSYFKQGTEGPCKSRRPAFWDIVGKAKYDAWKRLGDMPKEKAMESYVNELKQIVETMSYTQNVADFYGSISELDTINVGDLELVAPEIMRSKSRNNSPYHERSESPAHNNAEVNGFNSAAYQNGRYSSGTSDSNSSSDDEYIDTVEVLKSYDN
jgi:acyl-CoA-binding protein